MSENSSNIAICLDEAAFPAEYKRRVLVRAAQIPFDEVDVAQNGKLSGQKEGLGNVNATAINTTVTCLECAARPLTPLPVRA